MKLHPSRFNSDEHRFGTVGHNPFRSLWLRYVPLWADRALRWVLWLLIGTGIAYGIIRL